MPHRGHPSADGGAGGPLRSPAMAKPVIIAKLTFQDGKREEGLKVFDQMFEHVNTNEPGTLIYALHTDDKDANAAYFYEVYSDKDAMVAHGGSDTMKNVGRGLKDYLAGRLEITMLTPVTAKGIEF